MVLMLVIVVRDYFLKTKLSVLLKRHESINYALR